MYELLVSYPDKYQLALFIEPYLSLLKSKSLYNLYDALKYQKKEYTDYTKIVIEEAEADYRLKKILQDLEKKLKLKY